MYKNHDEWEILFEKEGIDLKFLGCLAKGINLLAWTVFLISGYGLFSYGVYYFKIFELFSYAIEIPENNFFLIALVVLFTGSLKSIVKKFLRSKNKSKSYELEYVEGMVMETHKTPSKNHPNRYGYAVTIDGKRVPVDVISFGQIRVHDVIRIEFQKDPEILMRVLRKR